MRAHFGGDSRARLEDRWAPPLHGQPGWGGLGVEGRLGPEGGVVFPAKRATATFVMENGLLPPPLRVGAPPLH